MSSLRIVVDKRERSCAVPFHLRKLGVMVFFKRLSVGDYIISGDCAVERKRVRDFVNSVIDGRLFDQASRISTVYSKAAIVVEGDLHLAFHSLKSGSKSFFGALSSVWLNFGVSSFFTGNEYETAELLYSFLRHEQVEVRKRIFVRSKPKLSNLVDRQFFVVQSFPGVGPKLALRLLTAFGSVRRIVNASAAELAMVDGLGKKKAVKLVDFFTANFDKSSKVDAQVRLDEIGSM